MQVAPFEGDHNGCKEEEKGWCEAQGEEGHEGQESQKRRPQSEKSRRAEKAQGSSQEKGGSRRGAGHSGRTGSGLAKYRRGTL